MITATASLHISSGDIRLPENTMFFDIETTGFSPVSTHLYLIGCCIFKEGSWQLFQWFDDTKTAEGEKALIRAFSEISGAASHCISFNGRTFDFPYIQKKAAAHKIADPLVHLEHTDLYRLLKPYKNLFALPDLKQKSVEAFLGLRRNDTYSGGELISVYDAYIRDKDKDKLDCLMLHNFEDVRGMFDLLPMMAYLKLFDGHFTVEDAGFSDSCFEIRLKLRHFIQIPVSGHSDLFDFQASAYKAVLSVCTFNGQLKYFYENYKDYDYLPVEDEAIHKSVSAFVDKKYRQKATRQNCYTKKTDCFLPEYDTLFSPVFKYSFDDKQQYFSSDLMRSPENVMMYARHLLASYGK